MPAAAVHAGLADFILPLDEVCGALADLLVVAASHEERSPMSAPRVLVVEDSPTQARCSA
jgi:hypothetical protein